MSSTIFAAIRCAVVAHGNQMRKDDGRPYADHVIEVGQILSEAGADEDTVIAGILHDTVEDTDLTLDNICHHFGQLVTKIVREVTDDPALSKEEQKRAQLAKFTSGAILSESQMVKLADAISNCQSAAELPPEGWSRKRALGYIAFKTLFAKAVISKEYQYRPLQVLACDMLAIGLSVEAEIHKMGYTFETLAEDYLCSRSSE